MIMYTFVTKEYEIDRDDSLCKMSGMIFNRMSIYLIAGGFKVDNATTDREAAPDQFTWMWEDTHGGK